MHVLQVPLPLWCGVCVCRVGLLWSQHWSTSIPGHSMLHDHCSNQPVIDPVLLLWIPIAHRVYMYESLSSFGGAPCRMPHLATLYQCIRMYWKAIWMGRVQSLYLHASISTLFVLALAFLLFIYLFSQHSPQHFSNAWWKPLWIPSGFNQTAACGQMAGDYM